MIDEQKMPEMIDTVYINIFSLRKPYNGTYFLNEKEAGGCVKFIRADPARDDDLIKQLAAPAVDLEALISDTALVAQNIDDGSGPHKQDVEWVIRHLAAQGMIKGVE